MIRFTWIHMLAVALLAGGGLGVMDIKGLDNLLALSIILLLQFIGWFIGQCIVELLEVANAKDTKR